MKFFEDVRIGDSHQYGSYTFTPEKIKAFARKFDPQPFHLDEEAAKNSLFGALCASGWHTTAAFMRQVVDYSKRVYAEAAARGETPARFGPSPGFKNLKWLKPVFANDTVTYSSEVIELRDLASRPEWGLMRSRTTGVNQKGERVLEFESSAFLQRRPK
ncbi:MAG TPA: MaoC family dehydratase [Xanthobacteraceae bacterium]|nr:MaoC family dehydratase [Xanthobacteraceae bacterium]